MEEQITDNHRHLLQIINENLDSQLSNDNLSVESQKQLFTCEKLCEKILTHNYWEASEKIKLEHMQDGVTSLHDLLFTHSSPWVKMWEHTILLEDREYQQDLSKLFTLLGNNLLEWWG